MFTVKNLKDLLSNYRNQVAIHSSTLDIQDLEAMQQESAYTFSFFYQFTEGQDNDPLSLKDINHIRKYFKDRWNVLKATNIAYTRHPFLPVNQCCLKVAEAIAGSEEAVCQILMPSLIGLNREHVSLKFETEVDGHFELEKYIINQDYSCLISSRGVF